MKTLESFDFGRQSSRGTYDWDTILDGEIHVLETGKDFSCKPVTIKTRARAVAKKMNLSVRTGTDKNGNVVIQSYEPSADDKEFEAAKDSEKSEKPRRRKRTA